MNVIAPNDVLYLAVSVVKTHKSIMKGVFGVGFVLFTKNGEIIDYLRKVWKPAEDDWESGSDHFWRTREKETYENLMNITVSPQQAKDDIKTFLDNIKSYDKIVFLVSDNNDEFGIPHFEVYFAQIVGNDKANLNEYLNDEYWSAKRVFNWYSSLDAKIMMQIEDTMFGMYDPLFDACLIVNAFLSPLC
jgi:hypothetical protein